ncbi:CRE-CUTL-14 protein [Caenorhabditis remanei]|uniref:CRE-CUTL-14 protein n=1 Tax=Caenorhabditis remanei TaxID=31234 RepID=E3LVX1_CAERE|nr:CRE-CUTL-14 protein [Caenorhabditis remanei]
MIFFYLPALFLFCHQISAIPIPNGLLGNVEVECTDTTIEAVFLTESNFLGRVFVLGHSQDKECVSREIGRRTTSITVPRDKCGVETVQHGKGAGYTSSVNIVISFHDKFLTKVDRAYNITCLFAPTGDVVSYALTVQPSLLKDIQVLADQPNCEYEVFDVRTRRPAEVVHVNAPLEHVWTCDGANLDLFCMRVHDCVINEGKSKRRSRIIDSEGCSLDTSRLPQLRYDNNKLSARVMSKAFRFGDDVAVEFECNVRLDLRNGTSCPRPRC